MTKHLTIGYFGDGPWAHRAFEKLAGDRSIHLAFVCARFDTPDPVLREAAAQRGIEFLTYPRVNSDDFLHLVTAHHCDLLISMSFDQIFRRRLIHSVPLQAINCHAGKLPFYRGRNILNWALINDEKEFGITVHYMDEGIDSGDIGAVVGVEPHAFLVKTADSYVRVLEWSGIERIRMGDRLT